MHSNLNKVTVLGTGILGGQISWQSAYCGKQVVVYGRSEKAIQNCQAAQQQYASIYQKDLGATPEQIEQTRAHLRYSTDLADAVAEADLVIETVAEIPEVKIDVYQQLAPLLPAHTLLVTNSSTLLPRQFADHTGRPDKYCALHFANLIWIINFAEIMAHPGTSEATLSAITCFAIEIGMVPIAIQKEQNGYVLNSWSVALLQASLSLITNGVSAAEDVDRTFMLMNRGSACGPFGLCDVAGMATVFNIFDHWGRENNDAQMLKNAEYLKANFIDKGLMGLSSGEGFYKYPNPRYQEPDFLAVPDTSVVPELVKRMKLS